MKEAGVNVVSIGIFSWALLETSDDKWDFGWLDDVLTLMHENGITVDLGTAVSRKPFYSPLRSPSSLVSRPHPHHPGSRPSTPKSYPCPRMARFTRPAHASTIV